MCKKWSISSSVVSCLQSMHSDGNIVSFTNRPMLRPFCLLIQCLWKSANENMKQNGRFVLSSILLQVFTFFLQVSCQVSFLQSGTLSLSLPLLHSVHFNWRSFALWTLSCTKLKKKHDERIVEVERNHNIHSTLRTSKAFCWHSAEKNLTRSLQSLVVSSSALIVRISHNRSFNSCMDSVVSQAYILFQLVDRPFWCVSVDCYHPDRVLVLWK